TGRHLEKNWRECLLYPHRAWRLCLGLAVLLAVLTAGMALFVPRLLVDAPADPWARGFLYLFCLLPLVPSIGLPFSFLECVLASAVQGEVYYIRWSGNLLLTIVTSGSKWLACFLAGPVVFAGTAVLYWLRCGEPGVVDWLILTELSVLAVASWIFTL